MRLRTFLIGALALLAGTSCVKIRPGAYQMALQRYYGGLLNGTSEQSLTQAIDGVTRDLAKAPADANLLLLRTSARLDLLRLGTESRSGQFDERTQQFFADLRLLQTLAERTANTTISGRVWTMFGDALLLKTQVPRESAGGAVEIREQIVQLQLFRLAADAYLRAGASAKDQELSNARDGYVNALTGMAQSENFLRLFAEARADLASANAILSGGKFPPDGGVPSGPSSFFSYPHGVAATQLDALEALTPSDFRARLQFALGALSEEIAARMLSHPPQPVSAAALPKARAIALYLAAATVRATDIKITGAGQLESEAIEFKLIPEPLYGASSIDTVVSGIILQAGGENTPVPFPGPDGLAVPTEGLRITIQSKAGTNTANTYFLGRTAALKSGPIAVFGPAGARVTGHAPQ